MEIKQLLLNRTVTFCYLVGDESSKTCALIDPAFETERLLQEVKDGGYTLTHIINTHFHSDHSAGNSAIKAVTGAKVLIHKLDAQALVKTFSNSFEKVLGGQGSPEPDVLLEDGDRIHIGETTLNVLHTPGHSPGGICLYADENLFTGDTLFVGAVGRTDLPNCSMSQLLKSIHEKLYTLPED
ncbi:MBL fold metallo-hydrolase, partial [Thermodesulfobacteriota bacterium]